MEATPEQIAEGRAIVRVLAQVLDRLVTANGPLARADPGQITKFHALKTPGIGILDYLERIHKYASCSNECFILALIYIDRLIQRNNFLLTEINVHRVIITAMLLAAKFFDDAYYNNAYYAKVGGVLVTEMNGLEVDFLFRINFSLHVAPDLFQKYRDELCSQAASTTTTCTSPLSAAAAAAAASEVVMCPTTTKSQHLVQMSLHSREAHNRSFCAQDITTATTTPCGHLIQSSHHPYYQQQQQLVQPTLYVENDTSSLIPSNGLPNNISDFNHGVAFPSDISHHQQQHHHHPLHNYIPRPSHIPLAAAAAAAGAPGFIASATSATTVYPGCNSQPPMSAPMLSFVHQPLHNEYFVMVDDNILPVHAAAAATIVQQQQQQLTAEHLINIDESPLHNNGNYYFGGVVPGSVAAGNY